MSRATHTVTVTRAHGPDLADLCGLWEDCRLEMGVTRRGRSPHALLRAALDRHQLVGFVARVGVRPVGYALCTPVVFDLAVEAQVVTMEQLYVTPEDRRQGIAQHLLTAVAAYADALGAEQVLSLAPATSKEVNRAFARWGFQAVVTRRAITTPALQRRLHGDARSTARLAILRSRRRRTAGPALS